MHFPISMVRMRCSRKMHRKPKEKSQLIELYWKCMTFTIASTLASAALVSNERQLIKMKISTNYKKRSTQRGDLAISNEWKTKTQHIYRWINLILTHHTAANVMHNGETAICFQLFKWFYHLIHRMVWISCSSCLCVYEWNRNGTKRTCSTATIDGQSYFNDHRICNCQSFRSID